MPLAAPPVAEAPPSLGAPLIAFRLPEPLTGRLVGPEDYGEARALLVAFLANRCPDVRRLAGALAELALDYEGLGLRVLAINAEDADRSPDEAPAAVAAEALRCGYVFPYLIDQTQDVARSYGAQRTPDFYLYGPDRRLAYHGRFDETRAGETRPPHGADLRQAVERALAGDPPADRQTPSEGRPIRWRDRD
jgi:thiol-disulfide isomerase/thioredoxin